MNPPQLTRSQRLEVARLSGLIERLTQGRLRGLDDDRRLNLIAEVSTDPVVLGAVLGDLLAPEYPEYDVPYAEGARLLRELGADEQVAAEKAAWLRERRGERGQGWITL